MLPKKMKMLYTVFQHFTGHVAWRKDTWGWIIKNNFSSFSPLSLWLLPITSLLTLLNHTTHVQVRFRAALSYLCYFWLMLSDPEYLPLSLLSSYDGTVSCFFFLALMGFMNIYLCNFTLKSLSMATFFFYKCTCYTQLRQICKGLLWCGGWSTH